MQRYLLTANFLNVTCTVTYQWILRRVSQCENVFYGYSFHFSVPAWQPKRSIQPYSHSTLQYVRYCSVQPVVQSVVGNRIWNTRALSLSTTTVCYSFPPSFSVWEQIWMEEKRRGEGWRNSIIRPNALFIHGNCCKERASMCSSLKERKVSTLNTVVTMISTLTRSILY